MYISLNLHDHPTHIQNPVLTDGPIHGLLVEDQALLALQALVAEARASYRLPDADAYARRLAEEAEAWLRHARERSQMKGETLVSKTIHSLAFSLRHRAHDFAVPSKLTGTSKHQPALWRLVKAHAPLGTPLDVEEVGGSSRKRPRLVVSHAGERVGEVQGKHVPWLCPLLAAPFGAGVFLVRVTGQERDYTLGCNVAFGRVGGAVTALNHALGTAIGNDLSGDGDGGDGAATGLTEAAPVKAQPHPGHGGDGAAGGLRLVSPGLYVAKTRADSAAREE